MSGKGVNFITTDIDVQLTSRLRDELDSITRRLQSRNIKENRDSKAPLLITSINTYLYLPECPLKIYDSPDIGFPHLAITYLSPANCT